MVCQLFQMFLGIIYIVHNKYITYIIDEYFVNCESTEIHPLKMRPHPRQHPRPRPRRRLRRLPRWSCELVGVMVGVGSKGEDRLEDEWKMEYIYI